MSLQEMRDIEINEKKGCFILKKTVEINGSRFDANSKKSTLKIIQNLTAWFS